MFKLVNAAIGLAVGVWLFSPQGFTTRIETPFVLSLRAQIAAEQPRRKLAAQWSKIVGEREQKPAR